MGMRTAFNTKRTYCENLTFSIGSFPQIAMSADIKFVVCSLRYADRVHVVHAVR